MDRTAPVIALMAVLGLSGCATVSPSDAPATPSPRPSAVMPSPIAVVPSDPAAVDPATVQNALRSVAADVVLAPYRDPDGLGVFPSLSFANQTGFDRFPRVGRVLVFPSERERIAIQPRFGPMSIQGATGNMYWDGPTHSTWIGVRNVIVEVVMPGGTFGKVAPWTDADAFLAAVGAALADL